MAILAFTSAAVGALLLPWKMERHVADSKFSKLQRLDLVGVFLMTGSLLLFILGLTSASGFVLVPSVCSDISILNRWYHRRLDRRTLPRAILDQRIHVCRLLRLGSSTRRGEGSSAYETDQVAQPHFALLHVVSIICLLVTMAY